MERELVPSREPQQRPCALSHVSDTQVGTHVPMGGGGEHSSIRRGHNDRTFALSDRRTCLPGLILRCCVGTWKDSTKDSTKDNEKLSPDGGKGALIRALIGKKSRQ